MACQSPCSRDLSCSQYIAKTIPSANFLQMKVRVKGDDHHHHHHHLAKDDVAEDVAMANDHHLLPCSLDSWGLVGKLTMVHKPFGFEMQGFPLTQR